MWPSKCPRKQLLRCREWLSRYPLLGQKETQIFRQTGDCYVIEGLITLLGIPGGRCLIHTRTCITADSEGSFVLVTGDVDPPPYAWLKESIREFFSLFIASYYRDLYRHAKYKLASGGSLGILDSGPVDLLEELQSSAVNHRPVEELRIYFDVRAFAQCLFRLSPVIIVVFVIFLSLLGNVYNPISRLDTLEGDSLDLADRMQRIDTVYSELREFLRHERHAHEKTNLNYCSVFGNLQNQVEVLEAPRDF